jgi:hypothetical protein
LTTGNSVCDLSEKRSLSFADQRRRARRLNRVRRGHSGSVTFIQRFGSALSSTLQFRQVGQLSDCDDAAILDAEESARFRR